MHRDNHTCRETSSIAFTFRAHDRNSQQTRRLLAIGCTCTRFHRLRWPGGKHLALIKSGDASPPPEGEPRKRPPSRRILIEPSAHHLLNAGDAAMLQVAAGRARELWPDSQIGVITESPDRLASLCPGTFAVSAIGRHIWLEQPLVSSRVQRALPTVVATRLRWLERWLRTSHPHLASTLIRTRRKLKGAGNSELRDFLDWSNRCDVLIVSGAGLLTDAYARRATSVLELVNSAVRREATTALMGQGVSRFTDQELVAMARVVLPRVDLIGLREERTSRPVLRDMGVPDRKMVTTGDDALELAFAAGADLPSGDGLGLGLRVARYSGLTQAHLEMVAAVVTELGRSLQARLVPIPISEVAKENDAVVLARIHEPGQQERAESPIGRVQRCRLVVAGSYHAAVFALAQGIPAIGLTASDYYTEKFLGLADQFNGLCPLVRLNHPSAAEELRSSINETWRSARDVQPALLAATKRQIGAGRAAYRRLHCVEDSRAIVFSSRGGMWNRTLRTARDIKRRVMTTVVPGRRFNCADQDDPRWDERASVASRLLAQMLDQSASPNTPIEIADLGCGNERLRWALTKNLNREFRYRGYDLRPQSSTVEYLDVRRGLPPHFFDVIFCLGLVEYLPDVETFAQRLPGRCSRLIISYVIADSPVGLTTHERRARGWRHSYTREGLEAFFAGVGFSVEGSVVIEHGQTVVWSWVRPRQYGRPSDFGVAEETS